MTTIEVKAEHIAKGERMKPGCCPISLAIKDRVDLGIGVRVYLDEACIGFTDFELPFEARQFVRCFDIGVEVKPFSFPLDIPADLLRAEQ